VTATESSAGWLYISMWLSLSAAGIANTDAPDVPAGPFSQAECVACHSGRDAALVAQWRAGPHGATADCVACHGERHGALPVARADTACTGCHDGALAHSYATSKHGVLVRIGRPDWSRPLQRGEHRAPGCAYCHLHDREHGDSMDAARGPEVREWVCSGCHAPRYVREQLDAGERLTAIADLKVAEAEQIAARHPAGADAVADLLASTREHLRNVRLGAGHQSPDYQWWHGQPALDGDLIRLRDAVARATRQAAGTPQVETASPSAGRESATPRSGAGR
jgi:formate-dependent nitrite reductase cytochrome c552 subunit